MANATIGPFELEAVLAEGGMGVVHRARGPDGRAVAVKVLRARLPTPDLVRRFEREALVRLDHPNVVAVLGAGADGGTPYIVFELLEGESLETILSRGRLPVAAAVDLARQICSGLGAAHRAGIVHRDLKPPNVFRCADGRYKLLDFGIALMTSRRTRLTAADSIIGTADYLSPEQIGHEPATDGRTDLWSLGVLLYEAVAGHPPFARPGLLETIVAIVREQHVPLRIGAPHVPPGLAAVIERALRKKRDERWPSADAMLAALDAMDEPRGSPAAAGATGEVRAEARRRTETIPPPVGGAERVVTLLLAERVHDLDAVIAAVEARGGSVLPILDDRVVGVFGGERSEGDEAARAVAAALDAREGALRVAVASGRAAVPSAALDGAALRSVEAGCAAGLAGVAVTAETARGLEADFSMREVSGELVEVVARRAATGTLGPAAPPRGREAELARIELVSRDVVEQRRAHVVLVSGPPGIGKTRVLREVQRALRESARPVEIVLLRAQSHLREVGLALWEPFDVQQDPGIAREELLLDELARRCVAGPLAVLVEDLQWVDVASLRVLLRLLDRCAQAPLLLLFTRCLDEDRGGLDPLVRRPVERIELQGLGVGAVAQLAADVLRRPVDEPLARALAAHTGGNPLFVEQILSTLPHAGTVAGDGQRFPLPLQAEGAVQARLDHLPVEQRELCARLSLLGRPFGLEEVRVVAGDDAVDALAPLCRSEILARRHGEYHFRSRLFAEVADRQLAGEERARTHGRIALGLRSLGRSDVEEIAGHHKAAGQLEDAALGYAEAALSAAQRGDLKATMRCSSRALEIGNPATRVRVLLLLADALQVAGHPDLEAQAVEMASEAASTQEEREAALARRHSIHGQAEVS